MHDKVNMLDALLVKIMVLSTISFFFFCAASTIAL